MLIALQQRDKDEHLVSDLFVLSIVFAEVSIIPDTALIEQVFEQFPVTQAAGHLHHVHRLSVDADVVGLTRKRVHLETSDLEPINQVKRLSWQLLEATFHIVDATLQCCLVHILHGVVKERTRLSFLFLESSDEIGRFSELGMAARQTVFGH